MEWAIMVVAIVAIVTFGKIYAARLGIVEDENGKQRLAADPDAARMRDEMKALKERVAVLERLVTENSTAVTLDREIEKLRSPDRV